MLDPMAELIIDDEDLVVQLTLGEKVWGFHGDIRVGLSSIVAVAPDPKPWLGLRGWRMAGVSMPGYAAGTRRHGGGYDFCVLHRDRPAVQVDVTSGRFSRLVICVPEGGDAAAEIFHEMLEHRWYMSEAAGRDVGTTAAPGTTSGGYCRPYPHRWRSATATDGTTGRPHAGQGEPAG